MTNQAAVRVLHGQRGSFVGAGAGKDRPALRDGVDLALPVERGTQGRAIVEIGAAIPRAVPAVFFNVAAQPAGLDGIPIDQSRVSSGSQAARELRELRQHVVEEE